MDTPYFVTTADGSQTLYHPVVGEHYHSRHGACQESRHVFLQSGLSYFRTLYPERRSVRVLEVGFGTGLNFLLTADLMHREADALYYCGIEAYPLPQAVVSQTAYGQYVDAVLWNRFLAAYQAAQSAPTELLPGITWAIAPQKVLDFSSTLQFDVVYFDAFAAVHQPEMWTMEVMAHIAGLMADGGVFVTYAITGDLKRALKSLGFAIEKAPGAPGKREMLRAVKR